jgi:hypothetical protein
MLLVLLSAGPATAAAPPTGAGSDDEGGHPVIVARACAGLTTLGYLLCAGAGGGWSTDKLQLAVLVGYSRLRLDHVVFGPGERWSEMRSFDGTLCAAISPAPAGRLRFAATTSVGRGRHVLESFGTRHVDHVVSWSASAGVGYGPAFLMVGVAGPDVSNTPANGTITTGRAFLVTLNLLFEVSPPYGP